LLKSTGAYEVAEASGVARGTKIIIYLRDDCLEFSKNNLVEGIFISF
jgi:HSP90 family molecular chaperone